MSGQNLPDWVMDLVADIVKFEEAYPTLYEAGERVTYEAPVSGPGLPGFVDTQGTLVGRKWCPSDVSRAIPDEARQAAYWYQRGKERG